MGPNDLNRLPAGFARSAPDVARYVRAEFGDGSPEWLLELARTQSPETVGHDGDREAHWEKSLRRIAKRAASFLF
jgi:hypothetical protein